MTRQLAGAVVVVTGASRGIGRSIALRAAAAGARVALLARTASDLATVEQAIDAAGGTALRVPVDVTDPGGVDRAAATVRAALGPADVVVNNAGVALRCPVAHVSTDQWRNVLATNLDGTFFVCRAFLSHLTTTRGRIINIASIAGREGTPLFSAYCAAKHGVIGLTRALAEELRDRGVQVNAVCPGSVDTAMLRAALPDAVPAMSPDDIATTVLFLAADAPPALTGACVDVFG